MQRIWDYSEYHLYQKLRRPVGAKHILKNDEEYNEYWDKIDWIRDWIRAENINRDKVYKHKVLLSKVYNAISGVIIFVLTILLYPLIRVLETCGVSLNYTMIITLCGILLIIGIWLGICGGWWNGEYPKEPREASVKDLLETINFRYGTPLVLALIIVKSFIEKDFTSGSNFRLCGSKRIDYSWHGLLESELYMLLADALILDECLSNQYKCKKPCVKCKAKEYNDDDHYYFHWRSIYKMSPIDILNTYNDEYLGRNGSLQPLPQYIEQRRRL